MYKKTPVLGSLFNKVADLQASTFLQNTSNSCFGRCSFFFGRRNHAFFCQAKVSNKCLKASCKTGAWWGWIKEISPLFCFLLWSCSSLLQNAKNVKTFFAFYHWTASQPLLDQYQRDSFTKLMQKNPCFYFYFWLEGH